MNDVRWIKETRVKLFDWVFRLADLVQGVLFFDRIPSQKQSRKKKKSGKGSFLTV